MCRAPLLIAVAFALPVFAQHPLPDKVLNAQRALEGATAPDRCARAIELAKAYRTADFPDSALVAAGLALRYAISPSDSARAHFALARACKALQDLDSTQAHARTSILIARRAGDSATWLLGEAVLAEVAYDQNRFKAALEHLRAGLRLALPLRDSSAIATAYGMLGNIQYTRQQYDSTRWYYDRSLAWMLPTDTVRRLRMALNQVNLFIEEERYDSAMARSDAMREEVAAANATVRSKYHNQRGYALFNMGRFRQAIPEFIRSDSINEAFVKEADLRIENKGFLAESYAAIGDSGRAYLLMLDLETLKDSFAQAAADERMLTLEKRFETRLNKEEIARLDRENNLKDERLRTRNLQLYGSLVLAVLAIGGIVLVWRNLRQKRRHSKELERLNAELHQKQARIEEINGLLRLKVLRTQMDPHFIHNCLNAIRALSLKGEHDRAEEYLEGFARLLRNVLEHSVRDRIPLEEEIAFLNDYVRLEQLRLGNDFSWSITAEEALLDEEPQVPSLLVQPFVENAIWHGLAPKQGAKRLEVRFASEIGGVTCSVQDNGVGRTAKAPTAGRTSLGLKLTGERLELLTERMKSEGAFTIEDLKDGSGSPLGTRITMILRT
jgi:tetratricopeptide (TPR) repeat protein